MSRQKVNFNTNSEHFEPTDIFWVPKGSSMREALKESELEFLLEHPALLEQILSFHGLEKDSLDIPVENDRALIVNHPKMYMQEHREHPCYPAFRNRSFDMFKFRLALAGRNALLEKILADPHQNYSILELGSGAGRALLELKDKFPQSQVFGISLCGESVDLQKVVDFFDLNSKLIENTHIIEADLNKKNLTSLLETKMDFIFSQATLRYIDEKVSLIEEIYEILKIGGWAVIELQQMQIKNKYGQEISLENFFNSEEMRQIFYFDPNTKLLFISKNSSLRVKLPLTLLKNQSEFKAAGPIPQENVQVGWSSVYIAN